MSIYNITVVLRKEIREQMTGSSLAILLSTPLLSTASLCVAGARLCADPSLRDKFTVMQFTRIPFGLCCFALSMLSVPLFYKESLRKTFEPLLTTPITASDVCYGKAGFITIAGLMCAAVTICASRLILGVAGCSHLLQVPAPVVVFACIVTPLVVFSMNAIVGVMLMLGLHPVIVNLPMMVVSIALFGGFGVGHIGTELRWHNDMYFIALSAGLLAVVFALQSLLTPEHVILGLSIKR